MNQYIVKRLFSSAVVLAGASILIFILVRFSPGDPIDIMFGPTQTGENHAGISEEAKAAIREELGIDKSYIVQYVRWVLRIVHLDFGRSFRTRQPVAEELLRRLPATVYLAFFAFSIEILLALPLGVLSALRPGSLPDHLIRLGAAIFRAVPGFWLGLLALFFFAVRLQWVAVVGEPSFRQVILPALTLGLATAPRIMRVLRASMLAELNQLYLVFGKAKGLTVNRLVIGHALRNAMLPVVALLGMSLSGLLSGSVIIESIFSWPGIGQYLVESIANRDYPVMQAYVLLTTVIVVLINLFADLSYTLFDPRVRLGTRGNR